MKTRNSSFYVGPLLSLAALLTSIPSYADLPPGYQAASFQEKSEFLWEAKILPTEYAVLPELKNPGFGALLDLFNPSFLLQSFARPSDEMPQGRIKLIHTYGSVAQVEFVATQAHGFTGIFASGAKGLARLSLATSPRPPGSFTPGMALKFFVSGRPSLNLQVMETVDGQGRDQNFFAHVFSNDLPPPTSAVTKVLGAAFAKVKASPNHLSVDHLARVDQQGLASSPARWPWQLLFRPTRAVQMDSGSKNDFRANLAAIVPDTVLYEVWAKLRPDSAPVRIGRLVTRSRFVASEYGDRKLFFQHNPNGT